MAYEDDRVKSLHMFFLYFLIYSYQARHKVTEKSLMTSSNSVCKFISCRFIRSVPDFVYNQYDICCMYSEENPQDFCLPVLRFYRCSDKPADFVIRSNGNTE